MRLEIEQREGAQRARIADRRRQLQRPLMHLACHEMQAHMEDGAIVNIEERRLPQAAPHESTRENPL
jgi:hypothetical protein